MAAMGTSRRFEILTAALALAEPAGAVSLRDAASHLDIAEDALRSVISDMLFVEFRTADGERISVVGAYDIVGDELVIHDDWLRNLSGGRPSARAAVVLSLAAGAYRRIADPVPTALVTAIEKLHGIVDVDIPVPVDRPTTYSVVRQARDRRRSLRFRYVKYKDQVVTDREVFPYDLFQEEGGWYVSGPEVGGGDEKKWRVSRMTDVEIGDARFELPTDRSRTRTTDLSHLAIRVEIRIPARLLPALPEPHVIVEQHPENGGRVRAIVEVLGERQLDHLLVALGPEGEVIEPAEYRDRRRARARELLAHVENPDAD